jgi:hypothetical protein
MKSAFTLMIFFFLSVVFRASAQEHVDVPLPPYDPPPVVSHHGEHPDDESAHVPEQAHAFRRTPNGEHRKKSADPHDRRIHRRNKHHSHFHWPWQNRK